MDAHQIVSNLSDVGHDAVKIMPIVSPKIDLPVTTSLLHGWTSMHQTYEIWCD